MNSFQALLGEITSGATLTREQAAEAMHSMAAGDATPVQCAAFLTMCRAREVTAPELLGFCDAVGELAVRLNLECGPFVDLCGTGGDGKDTFNISTVSSFVAAGTGALVVKHGNYGFSSRCGSSNLLEALGVKLPRTEDEAKSDLERAGITFLHAPLFHPAVGKLAPVRRELGFRTIFNIIGPLVNPARPPAQMIGVYPHSLLPLYSEVLKTRSTEWILVHSLDGYDEVSLTGAAVTVGRGGETRFEPQEFGLSRVRAEDLYEGGSVADAKERALRILRGEATAAEESVVAANAALALRALHPSLSLADGVAQARESLRSERAYKALERLCV